MLQVQRANVILTIKDDLKDHYLAKGFDVINDKGEVVQKAVAKDLNSLKREYNELLKENAKLKAKVKELEEKSEPNEVEDEEEVIEKPKRRKNK